MFANRPLTALALAAILGPFGFASCAVTSTPPPPRPPAAFEAAGGVTPLGEFRVMRFRDVASSQEYLVVTQPHVTHNFVVVAVPR